MSPGRSIACRATSLLGRGPLVVTLMAACTAAGHAESALDRRARADELNFGCARKVMGRDSIYRMPLAGAESDPALASELEALPERARRVALAAGLEPLLARLLSDRRAAGSAPSVTVSLEQQELALRLIAFDAQLGAAAFEAGCTARHLQQQLDGFSEAEQRRQLSLAVMSLVSGAVIGTASSVWALADDAADGPTVLAIGGGLLATGIGGATLVRSEHSLWLEHPRNRLTPIWRGEDPDHLYPTFVFRMIASTPAEGGATPRATLLAMWREQILALPLERQAQTERRLFGEGGLYFERELMLRAGMFADVEAAVQGVARDVELLHRALVRLLAPAEGMPALRAPETPPLTSAPASGRNARRRAASKAVVSARLTRT